MNAEVHPHDHFSPWEQAVSIAAYHLHQCNQQEPGVIPIFPDYALAGATWALGLVGWNGQASPGTITITSTSSTKCGTSANYFVLTGPLVVSSNAQFAQSVTSAFNNISLHHVIDSFSAPITAGTVTEGWNLPDKTVQTVTTWTEMTVESGGSTSGYLMEVAVLSEGSQLCQYTQVRSQNTNFKLGGAGLRVGCKISKRSTASQAPKRRGRPVEYDVVEDQKIYDAWKLGHYPTMEKFASESGRTEREVQLAVDRVEKHLAKKRCQVT